MINIQNLTVSFTKEYDALHEINLTIEDGQKLAIVGDKDSGKTTLLRTLAKLEQFSSGEILINNKPIKEVSYKQDVQVGYVPRNFVFKEKKTVLENLKYILKIRNIDEASINFKLITALKTFNIESIKNVPVKMLSNYQKMLVQIARVSMRKVDFYLIDDITEEMSKEETEGIISAIKNLMEINPEASFIIAFSNEKTAKLLDIETIKLKLGSIEQPKNK